jgi:plasmid stabilization system protein ParE
MKRLVLSRSAARDLDAIDDYTIEQFGIEQAERLRKGFAEALQNLQRMPESGRERPDLSPPERSLRSRLVGKPLLVACLLAGTLAPQEPPPATQRRLDLEALAKKIDPGETPAVLPLVPQALVEKSKSFVEGAMLRGSRRRVLRWSEQMDPVLLATAIHVLGQSDAARRSSARLLQEIRACERFARSWRVGRRPAPRGRHAR